MDWTWILFTILAAFMQSVRTAGQKKLAEQISPLTTTLVRYLYGLPFVWGYLFLYTHITYLGMPILNSKFILYASLAGATQIGATIALIQAMTRRNFAVGTTLAKTEAIQTAWMGAVFFSSSLNAYGWASVLIGFFGVVVISSGRNAKQKMRLDSGSVYGLISGLGFATTSLLLREASLSLLSPPVLSAAVTLAYMVTLQAIICLLMVWIHESKQLQKMVKESKTATLIGATSALGSAGWFTAMTLENPALVKTLGQVEFFFTLALTYLYFQEKVRKLEYLGMSLVILSVLVLFWGNYL